MGSIVVAGTGWRRGQLTLEVMEALKGGARVILHTDRCACAAWLRDEGVPFESLDHLYESCEDFDDHAEAAANAVCAAAEAGDVVYGVFDVRDRSVSRVVDRAGAGVRVLAGPPAEGALLSLVTGEARCVEASDWERIHLTARENCFIREIVSRELAGEVKLRLMEVYPEDTQIQLLTGDADPVTMPLYALDRAEAYDHRTCALVPAQRDILALERYDAEHLNEIIRRLCAPDGCPWDRVQTHESLRPCILEEAYEVIDAIDGGSPEKLYDELGDMLLQIALHAEIGRRHGEFDISDVTTAICEKMIHRHTHVFGQDSAGSAGEVLGLWSKHKMAERGQNTRAEAMRDITRTLPATLRAAKLMKRSAEVGICAADIDEAMADCRRALERAGEGEAAFGDALMAMCNLSRMLNIDPELALNGAATRFVDRFEAVEREMLMQGATFDTTSPDKLREYWRLVKL